MNIGGLKSHTSDGIGVELGAGLSTRLARSS